MNAVIVLRKDIGWETLYEKMKCYARVTDCLVAQVDSIVNELND